MATKSSLSKGGFKTVTAKTSSGKTITMTVSAGIAKAAATPGSNVYQAGIRTGGSSKPSPTPTQTSPITPTTPTTPTPTKTTVSVSPAVAAAIAKNPSAYPSNYSYQVVNVATGKPTGQTVSATGAESKGLGTFTGAVQDVTGLSASQIASGQAKSTKIIQDNKMISSFAGGFQKPQGISNVGLVAGTSTSGKPISTYTAAPAPKDFLEKARRYLNEKGFRTDNPAIGFGKSLVGFGTLVQQTVTHPIQTSKSFISGGKEVGRRIITGEGFPELGSALYNKPGESIGYIAGEIATGYGLGSVGTKIIKTGLPTVRKLDIPTDAATTTFRIAGYETKGGRSLSLGYLTPGDTIWKRKIGLGSPNVRSYLNKMPDTTEIKLGSALETSAIRKSLGADISGTTERSQKFIPLAQTILRKTKGVKSKFMDKTNLLAATERLPQKGVKTFLDIAKERGGILFGSKSRAAQLSPEYNIGGIKYKLNKVPRDVELRFDKLDDAGMKSVTDDSIKRLKKLGTIEEKGVKFELGTAREISDTPFAIEAKVNGRWEKVAEFKGGGSSIVEGEKVPEYVLGIKKTGKDINLFGFRATPLSEELRGVTQGIARLRKSKETGLLDIFPSPKREKDISSVSVSARTLEMSRRLPSPKLRKSIEELEKLYPENLLKQQLKKVGDEPRSLIADFSGKQKSPLFSFSEIYTSGKAPSPSIFGITKSISPLTSSTSYFKTSYQSPSLSPIVSSPTTYLIGSPSPRTRSGSPSPSPSPSPRSPSPSPLPISPSPISPSPSPIPSPSPSPSKSPSPFGYSGSPSPSPSPQKPTKTTTPSPTGFMFPGEKKKPREYSWDAFALIDSTKGQRRRWVQISNNTDRTTALSIAGDFVDKSSLSARFKIVPDNEPRQNRQVNSGWNNIAYKFREFVVRTGTKLSTRNQYIERSKYRADSPTEAQNLQYARASTLIAGNALNQRNKKSKRLFKI